MSMAVVICFILRFSNLAYTFISCSPPFRSSCEKILIATSLFVELLVSRSNAYAIHTVAKEPSPNFLMMIYFCFPSTYIPFNRHLI